MNWLNGLGRTSKFIYFRQRWYREWLRLSLRVSRRWLVFVSVEKHNKWLFGRATAMNEWVRNVLSPKIHLYGGRQAFVLEECRCCLWMAVDVAIFTVVLIWTSLWLRIYHSASAKRRRVGWLKQQAILVSRYIQYIRLISPSFSKHIFWNLEHVHERLATLFYHRGGSKQNFKYPIRCSSIPGIIRLMKELNRVVHIQVWTCCANPDRRERFIVTHWLMKITVIEKIYYRNNKPHFCLRILQQTPFQTISQEWLQILIRVFSLSMEMIFINYASN